ncbi:MAG TPA: ABC transporter ATP-binding protein [Pseudonocardiaceae bacterium]|nr:ABC transporter ATP-binding protein [Pseudonocardiaceae bacterium]
MRRPTEQVMVTREQVPMPPSGGELAFTGLGKTFGKGDRQVTALTDVDLTVRDGEFVAFLGPSGCGKSTLLRILMGLETVSTGTVSVGGRINPAPARDRALVFQGDSLLPWRTVAQNAELGLEFEGVPHRDRRAQVDDLLRLVGLSDFGKRYPHELSGGMRQRVNLIRALAIKPSVLLMDEPFGALDALTREVMQTELLRIWHERASTVCFVTHSIEEAVFLADRVVVFAPRPGRIVEDVVINLPRPRELEMRRTPEFVELAQRLWNILMRSGSIGIGSD